MEGFELKLKWAEHQFEVFEHQRDAWHAGGGYGVVFEPQPDSPEHIIRLKAGTPPEVFPLVIGDALQAMRSGLDHLAYALASAYTSQLSPDQTERVEFPVFGDRSMTASERERKIGALDPDAATVIEGLQPCDRGDPFAEDPLWTLYDLARIDRHRLLHLTVAQLGGIGVGGDNLHIEDLTFDYIRPDLEDGAELGRCSVRPIDPGRPMQMKRDT